MKKITSAPNTDWVLPCSPIIFHQDKKKQKVEVSNSHVIDWQGKRN